MLRLLLLRLKLLHPPLRHPQQRLPPPQPKLLQLALALVKPCTNKFVWPAMQLVWLARLSLATRPPGNHASKPA